MRAGGERVFAIDDAGGGLSPRARSAMRAANGAGGGDDDDAPTVVLGPGGQAGVAVASSGDVSLDFLNRPMPGGSAPEDVLLVAAAPILALVAQLRNSVEFADVAALRRRATDEVTRFETRAVQDGAAAGEVTAARYVICALIDETVLMTPWGSRSAWSSSSLLNEFHGETWGGEKVFQLLDRIRNDPQKYMALLRLIEMALLLGFEGRYRVLENGRYQLEDLRNELGDLIRSHSVKPPAELSVGWEGIEGRKGLRRYIPLWVLLVLSSVVLVIVYGVAWVLLGEAVGPVQQLLNAVDFTGS